MGGFAGCKPNEVCQVCIDRPNETWLKNELEQNLLQRKSNGESCQDLETDWVYEDGNNCDYYETYPGDCQYGNGFAGCKPNQVCQVCIDREQNLTSTEQNLLQRKSNGESCQDLETDWVDEDGNNCDYYETYPGDCNEGYEFAGCKPNQVCQVCIDHNELEQNLLQRKSNGESCQDLETDWVDEDGNNCDYYETYPGD